ERNVVAAVLFGAAARDDERYGSAGDVDGLAPHPGRGGAAGHVLGRERDGDARRLAGNAGDEHRRIERNRVERGGLTGIRGDEGYQDRLPGARLRRRDGEGRVGELRRRLHQDLRGGAGRWL